LEIRTLTEAEPSKVSPPSGSVYDRLETLINAFFPGAIVTPYLVMAGTDSQKYYRVCDNVYRFTPALIANAERATIHSTGESISVENYGRMIDFYERFIEGF
jgi:carboxypeptidase PM20D1